MSQIDQLSPVEIKTLTANETVTVGEWLITMIIGMIPLLNIIMAFVWAFGGGAKPSKANFFKAYLILMLISFAFIALLFGSLAAMGVLANMDTP
ncbi:MAG: hypothetical protein Q4D82_02860 [Neisseria sp.]|nr:hypothetical protein [Neisseria sp.]